MNPRVPRKRSPQQVAWLAALTAGALFFLSQELLLGHPERWQRISPWAGEHVMSLARDRAVLYAGLQGGGLMVREDGEWSLLAEVIPHGFSPVDLALAPGEGLLAATTGGLYRSLDGGREWDAVVTGAHLLQVSVGADGHGIAAGPGGVFRSVDGGRDWEELSRNGLPAGADPYRVLRLDSGGYLLGTVGGAGVYHRAPDGNRWRPEGEGLHRGVRVFSLLVMPDGALLAGTDRGAYRREPAGGEWSVVGRYWQTFRVLDLALDRARGRLWAASDDGLWIAPLTPEEPLPEQWSPSEAGDPLLASAAWVDATAEPVMATAGAVYEWSPDKGRRPSMVAGSLLIAFGSWLILRAAFRRRR